MVVQSADLIDPSDSAAACFYFTNSKNTIIDNAASGGWTGFAFPRLDYPIRRVMISKTEAPRRCISDRSHIN